MPGKPNVLLYVLDAARADHLGVYGYQRETTPHIDAFAEQATVFEAAFSEGAFTFTSIVALMTGQLPAAVGMLRPQALPSTMVMLAERARQSGYRTFAYSENPYISEELGFDQGFARFEESFERDAYKAPLRDDLNPRDPEQSQASIHRALEWMSRPEQEPFFTYIHVLRPHNPYLSPPDFRRFSRGRRVLGSTRSLLTLDRGAWRPSPAVLREIIALYDENLAYGDDLFHLLWTGLRDHGLEKSTVVVVISDHGEAFGEHGRFLHGSTVYDEMTRIPMIVRHPSQLSSWRIATPVQLHDLTRTLLDLFGASSESATLPGRSLLASLKDGEEPGARTAFSWSSDKLCAVRSAAAKLILHLEAGEISTAEWFDLAVDPSESHPRSVAQGGVAAATLLEQFRVARAGWAITEKPTAPAAPLSPKRIEQLRALGYSQDPAVGVGEIDATEGAP